MDALILYAWHGNVRELEYLIERLALTAARDQIDYLDLPEEVLCPRRDEVSTCLGEKSLDEITDDLAKQVIRAALRRTNGNKAKAAELLRIPPSTLWSKMRSTAGASLDAKFRRSSAKFRSWPFWTPD